MDFELFCSTMLALLFGTFVCFAGYRFFIVLLPIWGMFFGLFLGAQTVQALLGEAFFATVTSWVVGFVVGVIFAVLAYLFYEVAVALIAGSLGYGVAVGLLTGIGLQFDFMTWIIGIVTGVALAIVTLRYNLAKYVIIIATGLGGAALTIATMLLGIVGMSFAEVFANPFSVVMAAEPIWIILFLVMGIAGIVAQWRATKSWVPDAYGPRILPNPYVPIDYDGQNHEEL